jgi:hypothetical protein
MNVLSGCFTQSSQYRVDGPDGAAQLRARGREHQDVVHELHIEQAGLCHSCIEIAKE